MLTLNQIQDMLRRMDGKTFKRKSLFLWEHERGDTTVIYIISVLYWDIGIIVQNITVQRLCKENTSGAI